MKKIKSFFPILLSFILPVSIALIACGLNKNFPIGDYTLNVYDGSLQHTGFISYYKEVLLGNESLFYSLKGALGYNFFATFIYYLVSPLNILIIFFKTQDITIFYSILFYIKIGLCGISSLILFNYFKRRKSNIIFSSCYALMAYNIVYYSNYMWIDSVIMAPLIILGIEKYVNDNKKLFYVIPLGISILLNFYIGYMLVIFSLLYFTYKALIKKTSINKKQVKDFIVLTVLTGFSTSIFLIPVFFELLNGKLALYTDADQTNYFVFSLDFINTFYKLSLGSFGKKDISYGTPNVYCSIFVISLVLLFFFNKKITNREKIVTGSVIAFYLLSFSFNLIDYAWHMFQRPIWFPNRYSFTFSLFLIIIAVKSFNNIESLKFDKKTLIGLLGLYVVFNISFIINKVWQENTTLIFAILTLLLLTLYSYALIFYQKKNLKFIYVFLIIELIVGTFFILKKIDYNNTIEYKQITAKSSIIDFNEIKKIDNSFYRVEFNDTEIHNNGALYNYNGVNYFNSLRNGKLMDFLENKLGMYVVDRCRITYNSMNPLQTTILGIKYFNGNVYEDYYKNVSTKGNFIYINDLTLPFIFTSDFKEQKLTSKNYNKNMETILNSYANTNKKIVEVINPSKKNLTKKKNHYYCKDFNCTLVYEGTAQYNAWLNFYTLNDFKYYSPTIYKNGNEIADVINNKAPIYLKKGDTYKIVFTIKEEKVNIKNVSLYLINRDNLNNVINKIKENEIKYNKKTKDNIIKINANIKKDSRLIVNIPFENGWHAYIDGKKVKTKKVYDTYLSINVPKGKHEIKFKFIPRGLNLGIIISLLSTLFIVIYIKKK